MLPPEGDKLLDTPDNSLLQPPKNLTARVSRPSGAYAHSRTRGRPRGVGAAKMESRVASLEFRVVLMTDLPFQVTRSPSLG